MPETRARDLANLAGAGATSSTVAYHETARGFTLPAGTGEANQVISSDGDGTTTWKTTLSAPEITTVTSDKGVNEYDSDGDDGAVIVINGTSLGNDASVLTAEISTDNFITTVQTSTISILSAGSQIQATFNGTETNYNSINAGETVKVKVTKSGLQSAQSATLSGTVTGDPTFSTTSTTASTHTGTLASTSLGSYGGQVAGGGDDSNTKLLLNFDRTGGTDIEDSSNIGGDGHKVTASGNAIIKASPFGDGKSAMFFDGSNDYLTLQASADLALGAGDFTIELWIKATDLDHATYITLFDFRDNDANTDAFWLGFEGSYSSGTDGRLYMYHNGVKYLDDGATVTENVWHHLAITRVGDVITAYVDGKATGTTYTMSSGTNFSAQNTVYIGRYFLSSTYSFKGYLDEIRIVKGTAVYTGDFDVPISRLSATQSNQGTNIADITGTATKLLIHSDQTADSSDFNHPLTLHSNAITNLVGSQSTWDFDGASDRITFPSNSAFSLGTNAFTAEAFIRFDSLPSGSSGNGRFHPVYRIGGSGVNFNLVDIAYLSSVYQVRYHDNVSGSVSATWSTPTTGTWYHLAITRDGATVTFYIDGTSIGTGTINSGTAIDAGLFQIGGDSNDSRWFDGQIDDFRLTLQKNYTGNFTAPTQSTGLTKTWSASSPAGYTASEITSGVVVANTISSNVKLLVNGDGAKFTDSSTSDHTITPTGSYHSQDHGGIAPALTFPASGKATGSAGVYFDGNGDVLSISSPSFYPDAGGTLASSYTVDFWVYLTDVATTQTLIGYYDSGTKWIRFANKVNASDSSLGQIHIEEKLSGSYRNQITHTSATITPNAWHHLAIMYDAVNSSMSIWIDGARKLQSSSVTHHDSFSGDTVYIGGLTASDNLVQGGYIDSLRWSSGVLRYAHTDATITVPTKIYGAYRSQDVGTIQLNATAGTGGGALDYAELSGGTALSTYGLSLSSSGAITGTLTGLDDNSNSGGVIRIRARANADDNRVTTLGGSSFTGITQNDNTAPVLFNGRRYVGNGGTKELTGLGFQPDFVWIKNRDDADAHWVHDSVRGVNKNLYTNGNASESSQTQLTAFNSDGFGLGYTANTVNTDNKPYIAWAWKAGGANTTNDTKVVDGTSSSISGTNLTNIIQSVNSAGKFSITKYRGHASTGSFPHNLGAKPDFVIAKNLTDNSMDWQCWHKDLDSGNAGAGNWIILNSDKAKGYFTDGTAPGWNFFNSIDNTSIELNGSMGAVNNTNKDYICYAWKAVSGVSAFGTYNGDGTNPVTVSNIGFKPRFLMVKSITGTLSWHIVDSFRFGGDTGNQHLYADVAQAELNTSSHATTFFSTSGGGFTLTGTSTHMNGANNTYIYMAFA